MKRGWAVRKRAPNLGERIKRARLHKSLTQEALAAAVGVSRTAVTAWESGDTLDLKIENLMAVATALEQTVEQLVFDESPAGLAEERIGYQIMPVEIRDAAQILSQLPEEISTRFCSLIKSMAPITDPVAWQRYIEQRQRRAASGGRAPSKIDKR